jgi:hypothetical protein
VLANWAPQLMRAFVHSEDVSAKESGPIARGLGRDRRLLSLSALSTLSHLAAIPARVVLQPPQRVGGSRDRGILWYWAPIVHRTLTDGYPVSNTRIGP